jgi:hypothetical protein
MVDLPNSSFPMCLRQVSWHKTSPLSRTPTSTTITTTNILVAHGNSMPYSTLNRSLVLPWSYKVQCTLYVWLEQPKPHPYDTRAGDIPFNEDKPLHHNLQKMS